MGIEVSLPDSMDRRFTHRCRESNGSFLGLLLLYSLSISILSLWSFARSFQFIQFLESSIRRFQNVIAALAPGDQIERKPKRSVNIIWACYGVEVRRVIPGPVSPLPTYGPRCPHSLSTRSRMERRRKKAFFYCKFPFIVC